LTRTIPIKERAHLDFRWEIYDLFNLKTWDRPASPDLSNPLFGVVTNASGNRTMQAGLKFISRSPFPLPERRFHGRPTLDRFFRR